MKANRLLKLADLLDTVKPRRFDIGSWTDLADDYDPVSGEWTPKKVGECGTTACAFGYAPTIPSFRRAGLKYSRIGTPMYRGECGYTAAEAFFGLDYIQSHHIFSGEYYYFRRKVTAKDVAKRIRKMVAEHQERA